MITPTFMGGGQVRQTVAQYGAKTAERLKEDLGENAILSAKDPRIGRALTAAKNMGNGISSRDLGKGWESQISMLPGHETFELSSHGPRATRQILSIDGESQQVTLTATYADGSNRVFDVIKLGTDRSASHNMRSEVDHQG